MSTITIEEAQARLPDLIENMRPGEELLITKDEKPVARLVGEKKPERPKRQLGTLRGTVDVEAIPIVSSDPILDAYGITRLW